MNYKTVFLLFNLAVICTSCGIDISSTDAPTVIPEFITATLPPAPIPQATATNLPAATPVPSITPIEGTTTTQVNVRAQTSTASETLGIVSQFAKIQVIGKDASGSWFQIVYSEAGTGYGWVRAEYVQVDASAGIPVVGSVAGSGPGVSGLVIQKINVRSGPATSYDSLGILNPKDVVFITGKDPSEAWMQIEFVNAPEGFGWAALEFLQVESVDSLPIVGNIEQATLSGIAVTPAIIILPAMQDGDSMQVPLAVDTFSVSGSRVLQINGDISAPDGDSEDWIQFTSTSKIITIQIICTSNTLGVEIRNYEGTVLDFYISCEEKQSLTVTPNKPYFVRLYENSTVGFQYTSYTLRIESLTQK